MLDFVKHCIFAVLLKKRNKKFFELIEDRIRSHPNNKSIINFFYNGEFDPGSG